MVFFIPIIMAAAAVASATSGAIAAARQSAGNAKVAGQIKKQIALEGEAHELLKKQRNLERANTFFSFQNEADQYRLQTRAAIQQTKLQGMASNASLAQSELEVSKATAQNQQNRQVQEQEQQQSNQQAFAEVGQAVGSSMEGDAKLQEAQAATTQATGQQGTRSTGAKRERLGLAQQGVNAQRTNLVNQVGSEVQQNTALNTRLFDLQQQATQGVIDLQGELAEVENEANQKILEGNRNTLNAQHRLFRIGLRANRLAERQRQRAQAKTDQLNYDTTISKLSAAMPASGSSDTLGAVLGGVSQIAGAVAPLFSSGGGANTSAAGAVSNFGLSQALSLKSASNVTTIPTNASYRVQGAVPASRISVFPPSVPSSRINYYPPNTTNGNDYPSITRIFS